MEKKDYFKLFIALLIPQVAGWIGAIFTTPAITGWYTGLNRPVLAPPNWLFGPVWTILFILMGLAVYLIWQKDHQSQTAKIALSVFALQLVLNTLWSIIFFGLHNPAVALVEIAFLWLAILVTIIYFAKISKSAAWLLVPYILWVSFASYLNYSFVVLNGANSAVVINNNSSAAVETVGLANPASVNCQKVGGNLMIQTKPDGGQYGLCYFDDARACEEWALLRGDCTPGGAKTTGYDTEEQKYCAWQGGHTSTNPGAVCTFGDGSTCVLAKLYNGECRKGQNVKAKYSVEKVLTETCDQDYECQTPGEYLVRSSCPFTTKCLDKKCTVICPKF
ncbi:MAG: tryptophan-rich sensory protein [Candidatus Buchananbacteria bacterium]